MSDQPPPSTRGQKRIEKLKLTIEQASQQLKDAEARAKEQARKDETARKVEAGALALNHMRENPGTEFASIMFRLLNRYVPQHRRHLFAEFGIAPKAPANQDNQQSGSSIKDHFPG